MVRFFGFRSQKLRFSGFGISCGLRFFSNLDFGFRYLSTTMAVFWILLPNSFNGFSGFAKKVTPRSHAKTVIPGFSIEFCTAVAVVVTGVTPKGRVTWARRVQAARGAPGTCSLRKILI